MSKFFNKKASSPNVEVIELDKETLKQCIEAYKAKNPHDITILTSIKARIDGPKTITASAALDKPNELYTPTKPSKIDLSELHILTIKKQPLLHYAARHATPTLIEHLIKWGFRLDLTHNHSFQTILASSALNPHIDVLKQLLKINVVIEHHNVDYNPANMATSAGRIDTLIALHAAGAKLNSTLFDAAIKTRDMLILDFLCKNLKDITNFKKEEKECFNSLLANPNQTEQDNKNLHTSIYISGLFNSIMIKTYTLRLTCKTFYHNLLSGPFVNLFMSPFATLPKEIFGTILDFNSVELSVANFIISPSFEERLAKQKKEFDQRLELEKGTC